MDTRRVAVIDLGSNSFKLLVAQGTHVSRIFEAYEDVRLLGKGGAETIEPEKFSCGIRAVKKLVGLAREYAPALTAIIGTSVFRTAANAGEFAKSVFENTGIRLRILSGEEEATGVAAGVATDALVHDLGRVPAIFDLGGGSLEYIGFGGKSVRSWQLGAVRLMREFVRDSESPLPPEVIRKIRMHVKETLSADTNVCVKAGTPLVFCGGVMAIAHRILAEKSGCALTLFPRKIPALRLEVLMEHLSIRNAADRVKSDGVPATRADIFPVALAVVLEVASVCGAEELIYSPRNLRYGIASKLIARLPER